MKSTIALAAIALAGICHASEEEPFQFSLSGNPNPDFLPPHQNVSAALASLAAPARHTSIHLAFGPIPLRESLFENDLILILPNFFGFALWSVSYHAPLEPGPQTP